MKQLQRFFSQSQMINIEMRSCKNIRYFRQFIRSEPGGVAQSVTCLATVANLTADPGVASSIPARSHTFMEIDLT